MKYLLRSVLLLLLLVMLAVGVSAADEPIAIASQADGTSEYLYTVADIRSSVREDCQTKISLLRDLDVSEFGARTLKLPYAATLDLGGFSLTAPGNGIEIAEDLQNIGFKTTICNGTIYAGVIGIRVTSGSLVLENVEVYSTSFCVSFYEEPGVFPSYDENYIIDCVLVSSSHYCVGFMTPFSYYIDGLDFRCLYLEGSRLVSRKPVFYSRLDFSFIELGGYVSLETAASDLVYNADVPYDTPVEFRGETLSGPILHGGDPPTSIWSTSYSGFGPTSHTFFRIVRSFFNNVYRFLFQSKVPVLGFSYISLLLAIAVIGVSIKLLRKVL